MLHNINHGMKTLRFNLANNDENVTRADIIRQPWHIHRDASYFRGGTAVGLLIVSKDNSTAIAKIVLGSFSIAVEFRDIERHKEIIAKSKHRSPTYLPDDIFMSVDNSDNTLSISWKNSKYSTPTGIDVVLFFNLLIEIENDVLSALSCVCDFLRDDNEHYIEELLSFFDVIEMLDNKAYDHWDKIKLTQASRHYLINQLMTHADNDENGKKSEILSIVANICADVPSSTVYYQHANQILLQLSYMYDPAENTIPQQISRLENRLRCAMRARDQRLIDLTYHELCQEPGVTPVVQQIQGDEDTLIQLAANMRQKNAIITQLKLQLSQTVEKESSTNSQSSPRFY